MKLKFYHFKNNQKTNGENFLGKIQSKYLHNKKEKRLSFYFPMWWLVYHCFRNLNFCFLFQSFCKYIISSFKRSNALISRVFLLKSRIEMLEFGNFFLKKLTKGGKFFKKKKYACFNSLQLIPIFKMNCSKGLGKNETINKMIRKKEKPFLGSFRIYSKKSSVSFLKLFSIFNSNKEKTRKKRQKFLNLNRIKKINYFSENFSKIKGSMGLLTSQRFMYGQKILIFFLKLGFAKINFNWKTTDRSEIKDRKFEKRVKSYGKINHSFIDLSKIKFLRHGKKNSQRFFNKKILNLQILPSKNKIPLKVLHKIVKKPNVFRPNFFFSKFVKQNKENSSFRNGKISNQEEKKSGELADKLKFKKKTKNSPQKNITNVFEIVSKESQDFFHEQIGTLYISQFEKIFREEHLDIWVNPFLVFCFDSNSGFLEMVPNSNSLHIINQKKNKEKKDSDKTFNKKEKELNFEKKTQNLIESLAGYSLICFILQLKDRHNGNILLNKGNRIIHIDFGFIFDFSPGNLKFEADSFKMSRQFLSWIGGKESEMFENLREIFIRGFFSIRKNLGKLMTLARVLIKEKKEDSRNKYKLQKFQKRFKLSSRDSHIIKYSISLFKESLENWKTLQYDKYQQIASGIE